jgi:uncharacterized protein (DUF1684 family)
MKNRLLAILIVLAPLLLAAPPKVDPAYAQDVAKWKTEHEQDLRARWLPVRGLFWLKEGETTFGSAADNQIVLPKGPAHAGVFGMKEGGKVGVVLKAGVTATVDGTPVHQTPLDSGATATTLAIGPMRMFVIVRGKRVGIRLLDLESSALKSFKGVQTFPIDPAWRVVAEWVPSPGKKIPILNVLGDVTPTDTPGLARFQAGGQTLTLRAVDDGDDLMFIFADATSGKTTYGAGRFLYAPLPKDGKVVLDFNKAETPPCGFTPYATCPLPPRENKLTIAIPAGERYKKH